MKRFVLVLTCMLVISLTAWADGITFNYEGRVKVSGELYDGLGYFKFAIVNNNGQISYWSNDGTSTTGNEPASYIISDVTDGIFNVIIGDTSILGMSALEPSMFNVADKVYLRAWFCDDGAAYEQLNPDRQITNPALLGSQSCGEIALYVNSATGDDRFTGLAPDRPKQTIQAAWDTLPPLIRSNATIHLASGVYREEVLLTGKTVAGEAKIAIAGDIASPTSVRITGADAGAETTPVRERGFRIEYQTRILIQGVLIDNYSMKGIDIEMNGMAEVEDCVIQHCMYGIGARRGKVIARRVQIQDDYVGIYSPVGIRIDGAGYGQIYECTISDFQYGIIVASQGQLEINECNIDHAATGVACTGNSYVAFMAGIKSNISYCTNRGSSVNGFSALVNPNGNVNYSNCTANAVADPVPTTQITN